jgi:hypothetical protein
MIPPFYIFRVESNDQAMWLETSESLESAKARVKELGNSWPGKYFVVSLRTGNKITVTVERDDKSR